MKNRYLSHIYYQVITNVFKIGYNKGTMKGDGIMANSLVQFRTDDTSKIKATNICERLGRDLLTYLSICISRLIQENGISDMTLDEINAEIAEARKQREL